MSEFVYDPATSGSSPKFHPFRADPVLTSRIVRCGGDLLASSSNFRPTCGEVVTIGKNAVPFRRLQDLAPASGSAAVRLRPDHPTAVPATGSPPWRRCGIRPPCDTAVVAPRLKIWSIAGLR